MTLLTPRQIEARAERMMDALDRRLMHGTITQAAYDIEVKKIDAETDKLWRTARFTIDQAY